METIATPKVLSESEHSIVSLLQGQCHEQAVAIQAQLKQLFGGTIWLQEPPALHITLMEIICDTDYGDRSRQRLFEQWYDQYNLAAREVLSTFAPFDVVFDELLVSQRAIIIKTKQSEELNKIRAALLSKIELPEGTKTPPDITHSTLARFSAPVNLELARAKVKDIPVEATQHITEFVLAKDLGPPIFNGVPMERYSLEGRQ